MPTSGEIALLDLGVPQGHEAGSPRPAVIVAADEVLAAGPTVVQVVPLTTTIRGFRAEVLIQADAGNGLSTDSAAQCQHVRSVSASRLGEITGRLSPTHLRQVREVLALLLDL